MKLSRNRRPGLMCHANFIVSKSQIWNRCRRKKDSFQNFQSGGRAHLFAQNLDRIHHVISRQRRRWIVLGLSADLPGRRPEHVTLSSYKFEKTT